MKRESIEFLIATAIVVSSIAFAVDIVWEIRKLTSWSICVEEQVRANTPLKPCNKPDYAIEN